jgi:hypothetical protein
MPIVTCKMAKKDHFQVNKEGEINGLLIYFAAEFKHRAFARDRIGFTNFPAANATERANYRTTLCYLVNPKIVSEGQEIKGQFGLTVNDKENIRNVQIKLEM